TDPDAAPGQVHADGLAGVLQHQSRDRLRRTDGRLHAVHAAGGRPLPARPAPDRLGPHRGRGEGLSEAIARQAAACVLVGFEGTRAPAWLCRQVGRGLGGVVLYAHNIESVDQVARLTRELRDARDDVLVCVDEEGGDVTRLEATTGSSYP